MACLYMSSCCGSSMMMVGKFPGSRILFLLFLAFSSFLLVNKCSFVWMKLLPWMVRWRGRYPPRGCCCVSELGKLRHRDGRYDADGGLKAMTLAPWLMAAVRVIAADRDNFLVLFVMLMEILVLFVFCCVPLSFNFIFLPQRCGLLKLVVVMHQRRE